MQASQKCTFLPLAGAKAPDPDAAFGRKGVQAKEKDNACHMRIELTRERYATLCAKAKKHLMKRALIERLLERGEISGYENSAVKRPEGVRRFCKAVPGNLPELWE